MSVFIKLLKILCSILGKESVCNAGDPSSIPELGRFPGKGIGYPLQCSWASLVAQLVKNLPAMQETWVRSLGWEDPLEKEMATHSSTLAWWATVHGITKSRTRLRDFTFTFTITTNALILTLSHRITTIISYLDFLLPTSNPFTFPSTLSTLQSRVFFLKHSPVTSIPTSKFSQILLPQNKI